MRRGVERRGDVVQSDFKTSTTCQRVVEIAEETTTRWRVVLETSKAAMNRRTPKKKPKEHGRVPSAFEFQREARGLATAVAATSTTASTVAAATTAAAASTVATATAASAASTAFFAGAGFVDGQRTSAVILFVQATDRFVGGVIVPHLDESETFAPTGVPVLDDLSTLYRAELAEQGFQV